MLEAGKKYFFSQKTKPLLFILIDSKVYNDRVIENFIVNKGIMKFSHYKTGTNIPVFEIKNKMINFYHEDCDFILYNDVIQEEMDI